MLAFRITQRKLFDFFLLDNLTRVSTQNGYILSLSYPSKHPCESDIIATGHSDVRLNKKTLCMDVAIFYMEFHSNCTPI